VCNKYVRLFRSEQDFGVSRDICEKIVCVLCTPVWFINSLTPNDPYSGRTASLTSKRCILYIYSTNISTEYFKHGIYSPFFFSNSNEVCFIILTYLFPVLLTFYIQGVLKLKKNNSGAKGLYNLYCYGGVLLALISRLTTRLVHW